MNLIARNMFNYFKKRPGLLILSIILLAITVINLKPDFYLMGWDNYSSYFNLKTNIFRTFFATWREYRGLGVPSDSESTDLFRQLFFLILSPFVKTNLHDQIFSLFSFNFGVIMVYLLAKKIFKNIFSESKLDLLGLLVGIFYIFNLNTLATFYFPMIMYINRFYAIPFLFFVFLSFIQEKVTWKKFFLFSLLIVFSAGSYMTATIFITVILSLGIFLLIQSENLKKAVIFLTFFLLLNSFWLFPFINYTINKSEIVHQAPTFIDANEIQLNKPSSFYSLTKQLILYPNFFDANMTSFDGSQTSGIHFIKSLINQPPISFIFFIFPLCYLGGIILLLIKYKDYKKYLWIPAIIFIYLFLSFKAFSPLGFIYIFLEKTIPFFSTLFRFGDTKFHYFINFVGSLSAGFFIIKILEKLNKKNIVFLFITLILIFVITFNSYFNGHLFGFFDLNKLPDVYFKIAKIINEDKDDYRVLHLPFNKDRYWRSYNWGYLGSSFFHILINKPLLEKTFEPASQENIELNQDIYDKIDKRNNDLYFLLKKTGVKYIIFDETVSSQITAKGIGSWGIYNYYKSKDTLNKLVSEGLIKKIISYNINILDYIDTYEKVFPLTQDNIDLISKSPNYEISLYELKDPDAKFRTVSNFSFTDPQLKNINIDSNKDTLQDDNSIFQTFPFKRNNLKFQLNNNKVELDLNNFILQKGQNYRVNLNGDNSKSQTKVEIYGRQDDKYLYLNFYNNPYPEIILSDKTISSKFLIKEIKIQKDNIINSLRLDENLEDYLSNWPKALPYTLISDLRIKIGDNIIPIPLEIDSNETYVGSLVLNQGLINLELLKEVSEQNINVNSLKLTDNSNCFSDKLSDYISNINYDNNQFVLESQNGTTCFILPINNYLDNTVGYSEIKFNYQSESSDLDSRYLKNNRTSKPILQRVVKNLNKPNYLLTCIKDANVEDCYNNHQVLDLDSSGRVIIPTDKRISAYQPIVFFALKNTGYQEQKLIINNLLIKKYDSVLKDSFNITNENQENNFVINEQGSLKLSFSLPLNYFSFYQNQRDGFHISNGVCNQPYAYRTFRKTDRLISYIENCYNNFFQSLNFDSNNSYIWLIDYNLASGKFPRFNLGDSFDKYTNQILSLYQGYPSIRGFKEFQNPEFFDSSKNIFNKINKLNLIQANVIISGDSNLSDLRRKNFMIEQDSENEGIAVYDNFNVVQIPNSWINLSIEPESYLYSSNNQDSISYQQMLPSLWKINSNESLSNQILNFNEGYDNQWGIYDGLFNLLIGKKAGINYKCNNYANCFKINTNSSQYYVFYSPEKLYFLGWLFTLLAIFFGKRMLST